MIPFSCLSRSQQVRILHRCDKEILELFKAAHPTARWFESELPGGVGIDGVMGSTDGDVRTAALVATKDFTKGEVVFSNDAILITQEELEEEPLLMMKVEGKYCIMCPDDHMLHREDGTVEMIGFDIFMDHSCDPNLNQTYHTKTNYTVTAVRDIKAGDKLTCDYQALMNQVTGSKSLVTTQFECRCGTVICRGLVLA
jgi:hypothetical protein